MSYEDQYDAPLNGVERVRVEALKLAMHPHSSGGPDAWVEAARPLERYIIGDRATGVQDQIDAAYTLAERMLYKASPNDWGGVEESARITVPVAEMRELVKMLSGLAGGPPF